MSSNYEWQNQYTKQRINDAHRQAAAHRAAKQGHTSPAPRRRSLATILASFSRLFSRTKEAEKQTLPERKTGQAATQVK